MQLNYDTITLQHNFRCKRLVWGCSIELPTLKICNSKCRKIVSLAWWGSVQEYCKWLWVKSMDIFFRLTYFLKWESFNLGHSTKWALRPNLPIYTGASHLLTFGSYPSWIFSSVLAFSFTTMDVLPTFNSWSSNKSLNDYIMYLLAGTDRYPLRSRFHILISS